MVFKKQTTIVIFLIAFVSFTSWFGAGSAQAQTVSRIQVQGNERVENATVIDYLSLNVGDRYSSARANSSLKTLFQTGLFSDVDISQRRGVVTVRVVENPIISRVAFEGNKRINDKRLLAAVQSKPRGVLTQSRVQSDVRVILENYRRIGRFNADVVAKTIERENNRVDLVFEISEAKKTKIRGINFIGNERFSDGRLRDVMATNESGFLNFLSNSDVYDPDRLEADLELLRRFYLNAGYADFDVTSSVADFDRENNAFFINITVSEGERYRFGAINVDTALDIDVDELDGAVRTSEGAIYNAERVDETLEALTIAAARQGYALARVRPRGSKNVEARTVDISYYVEEGARIYVERINIFGNERTREYVIRREFDIDEGDAYNQVLIDRARLRLMGMGLFETVDITRAEGSASDRVILNVNVAESSSASLSAGGGYSTGNGFIADISFTERNFMGRGQAIKASFGLGTRARDYNFSFTEPRFMGRRISAGFDLFREENDYASTSSYRSDSRGGALRMGLMVSDRISASVKYNYSDTKITVTDSANSSQAIRDAAGNSVKSSISYGLTYDGLDNKKDPTNGLYFNVAQEVAGLGGDQKFVRTNVRGSFYQPISGNVIGVLKAKGGHITGYGGQTVRLLDSFKAGGESVRGFSSFGIGPRDSAGNRDPLGGTAFWAATAEVQFPLLFLPKSIGLKGALFADAGSLYNVGNIGSLNPSNVIGDGGTVRSSVGASVIWASPFGPLRGDFAHVLNKDIADETQFFRFGIDAKF